MSKELIEKTANEIGFAGFFQAALESTEQGDASAVVCTATSLLMSLKPQDYEVSINYERENEFDLFFISDVTKKSYNFTLPLDEEIKTKGKVVEALFGALSLEFAFKSAEVSHAKRVQ